MSRRRVMGLLAGAASAVLAGCGLLGSNSYRFRMTVEAETPQGPKRGTAVYAVKAQNHTQLLPDMRGRSRDVRGEAVAVDLPGGRTFFALLKTMNQAGDDDLAYMSMATLDPAYKNDWVESARRISSGEGIRSPAEVAVDDYPLLVTFRDIADPASVEQVDPADLASSFGPGVRLKRITVEITDDPVTTGIEKRLGWLSDYYAKRLDGQRFGDGTSLANDLSAGAFSTESHQ